MKTTKDELLDMLTEAEGKLAKLKGELKDACLERDRLKHECYREAENAKLARGRLAACRQSIKQRLNVKYGFKVQAETEFFRGKYHDEEGVTEDIRFLRWLHGELEDQLPF